MGSLILSLQHPAVRHRFVARQTALAPAKTRILARFYSSLAPELKQYFEQAGLTFSD